MINFVLANSADSEEMLHHAALHLGLHCLSKYQLRGFLTLFNPNNTIKYFKQTIYLNFVEIDLCPVFKRGYIILKIYVYSALIR